MESDDATNNQIEGIFTPETTVVVRRSGDKYFMRYDRFCFLGSTPQIKDISQSGRHIENQREFGESEKCKHYLLSLRQLALPVRRSGDKYWMRCSTYNM